jgi:hypothetical protein
LTYIGHRLIVTTSSNGVVDPDVLGDDPPGIVTGGVVDPSAR